MMRNQIQNQPKVIQMIAQSKRFEKSLQHESRDWSKFLQVVNIKSVKIILGK